MSDLFHEAIPQSYLRDIFRVMNDLPQHTFQILTKRAELAGAWRGPWTDNIWMGVSVEDRKSLPRIDSLRECGAKTKFVSFEPLLEDLGVLDLYDIEWAIVGGESGPNHRKLDHRWARTIRNDCVCAGVAFFFKQDSGPRTEMRPWLVEDNGSKWQWHQFPQDRSRPVRIAS